MMYKVLYTQNQHELKIPNTSKSRTINNMD